MLTGRHRYSVGVAWYMCGIDIVLVWYRYAIGIVVELIQ